MSPTLILLPGLLNDPDLWRHQVETLGDMATVVVGDLTRDDSIHAMARRVLDTAPRRFSLAGLSMGGYVAQEIMRQAPQRVERLALVDTAARADLPEQTERRKALIEQTRAGRFDEVMPGMLPMLVHPDHVADPTVGGRAIAMAQRVGPDVFIRQQTAIMGRPDGREDLKRITCPTLVLVGRQDAVTPPKVAEEMLGNLATGRLVVIEDCGHLSPIERPQAVSAVLRYWLQEQAPASE
jgi:pimeloyl-ACP methyl ester carboxylesterase